jgi:hypothetical protein
LAEVAGDDEAALASKLRDGELKLRTEKYINRVTRLGEFSPIWRLLTLSRVFQLQKWLKFLATFFTEKAIHYFLTTKWFGGMYIHFGHFFHKFIMSP